MPKKKLDNLNINTVRVVKFSAHIPHMDNKADRAPTSKSVQFSQGPLETYLPMAVMKLRTSKTGRDRVRLYNIGGQMVVPNTHMAEMEGYVYNSWRLHQQDSSYMLYYMRYSGDAWSLNQNEVRERVVDESLLLMARLTTAVVSNNQTENPVSGKDVEPIGPKDTLKGKKKRMTRRIGESESDTDYIGDDGQR